MRYIRTKQGYIIDLTKCVNPDFFKSMAVKQADTIEELCDAFVVRYFNGTEFYADDGVIRNEIIHTRLELLHWRKSGLNIGNYKGIFYGAIWIKGSNGEPILKAVTKPVNEKEEFELL